MAVAAATLRRLAELEARAAARRSAARPLLPLAEWARYYLPGYFPVAPSSFHRWLTAELGSLHQRRGTRLNVLAPRGAAKSTWSSFAYPLWAAVHALEPYIVLTSDTGQQAHKYLDSLRAELESNDLLARDYPHLAGAGPTWRQDRIRLANGVMVEALGTGTKLRGRKHRQDRPSLIVVDDPQNTAHIISPVQRERTWEWLVRDVCNAGSPTTNIVVLGTALHRECIVCRAQATVGWRSQLFRSVVSWPERMDLWREWEECLHDHDDPAREDRARLFYLTRKADMDRGALVLWPEREDLYALMLLRASIGPAAFGSEKQNDPTDPSLSEWPPEWFERADLWFATWPEALDVRTMALDPSKGRDARHGDYSAIVMYGRCPYGLEYVEADLERRPTDKICTDLARHAARFKPDGIVLEANTFQELLAAPIRAALLAAGVECPLHLCDNTAPKPVRIRRLTPALSERRARFKSRSPGTARLVQQLRDFPNGDHDDGPDAFECARRLAIELVMARRKKRGPDRFTT